MEPTFTPEHSLDSARLGELARLLNVVAYNAPDAPYVPLFHPVAGLLLEAGLNEEEVDNYNVAGLKCNPGARGLLRSIGSPQWSHLCDTIPGRLGHSQGCTEAFGQVSSMLWFQQC